MRDVNFLNSRNRFALAAKLLLAFSPICLAQPPQRAGIAEQYLLSAANVDRASRSLPQVETDENLSVAALAHARKMARSGTISHKFVDEADLADRAATAGTHFSRITENVAQATNASVIHDLWMQSAGHRANLLDPNVNIIGIAVVQSGSFFYAVEDFARSVPQLTFPRQEAAIARLITATGVSVTPSADDAREICSTENGYAGSRKPRFTMRFTAAALSELPSELTARLASGKYHDAIVIACPSKREPFAGYSIAVQLYP